MMTRPKIWTIVKKAFMNVGARKMGVVDRNDGKSAWAQ
jgi:hypothetical protein